MSSDRVSLNLSTDAIERATRSQAIKGVTTAAEHVLNVANERVPLDTGVLQNSGRTHTDESSLQAAVYYDTPYAVAQHENMQYRHDAGRQAKYLETALLDEQKTVAQILRQALAEALGG